MYKEISIYGAGVYGVLLALQLINRDEIKSKGIKVNLYEKGPTIMPGWKSISLGGHKFNSGFHGIEMPRAEVAFEGLSRVLGTASFTSISNNKLCMIEDMIVPFGEKSSLWPTPYKEEFLKLIEASTLSKKSTSEYCLSKLTDHKLGRIIEKCSYRYSDELANCWHSFYPWFYPSDFFNEESDEGWLFRNPLARNYDKPYYNTPSNGLFESLIEPLEQEVRKCGVNLIKNTTIDKSTLLSITGQQDMLPIWTASSAVLLFLLNRDLASNLLSNKRYMNLVLLESLDDSLNKWLNSFSEKPSEVICVNTSCSGLARISFPSDMNTVGNIERHLLIEIIGTDKELTSGSIKEIENAVFKSFGVNAKYSDHKMARTLFTVSDSMIEEAQQFLTKEIDDLALDVPYSYWWPINIAKCGHASKKVADMITSKL